jgi:DNA-binding transcriptional MocR family regulator
MARTDRHWIQGTTSRAIARSVETLVADGVYPEGSRLPTVRALSERLGVSPGTVAAAYRSLSERGLLSGRGRAGTTVTPRQGRPGPRPPAVPTTGVIDLASDGPDPALAPDLRPALDGLARELTADGRSRGRDGPAGPPELTATVATWIGADGGPIDVGAEGQDIVVVGGVRDGLDRTLRTQLRSGQAVLVEDPAPAGLLDLIEALGLVPVGVPVDPHGMDPDVLASRLARTGAPRPAAVVLTARAHDPTGASITPDRSRMLHHVLARFPDVLTIENDPMGPLSGVALSSVPARGELTRWVHLYGLSAMIGSDLRVAALTGDPVSVERIRRQQRSDGGWVSLLIRRITHRMLTDPALGTQVVRAAAAYARRRESLTIELSARGVPVPPGQGPYLWIEVPAEARAAQAALAAGIAVHPGESFRIRSAPAVRLSTATLDPASAPRVAEILSPILIAGAGS